MQCLRLMRDKFNQFNDDIRCSYMPVYKCGCVNGVLHALMHVRAACINAMLCMCNSYGWNPRGVRCQWTTGELNCAPQCLSVSYLRQNGPKIDIDLFS